MFEITTDPHRKLVRLTLKAMLTEEQVADLYRQEHHAIRAMGCALGEHLCIVDLTACPLQAKEVAEAFRQNIGSPYQARRLAMYTGKALARMQAKRVARERGDVAIFEHREEAEAWLFSSDSQKAA